MLNRVIDKTTPATPAMMQLINAVVDVVPTLMTDFQNKALPSLNTVALMSAADWFAKAHSLTKEQIDWAVTYTHRPSTLVESVITTEAVVEEAPIAVEAVTENIDEQGLDNVTIPVMAAIQVEDPKDDLDDIDQEVDAISFGEFEDESFDVPIDLGEESDLVSSSEFVTENSQFVTEPVAIQAPAPEIKVVVPLAVTSTVPQHIAIPEDFY